MGQDVKLVSETTKLKFAVLCIGGTLTMGSEEAIRAPGLLQCKDVMGVHYDTFPLHQKRFIRLPKKDSSRRV
jgi:L-ascorbate metabolism protein UlaG (beta-lactamase superfamily)